MSKTQSQSAYDHLWMHFTRMSPYENAPVPTIVRGEGTYVFDADGKRYLDDRAGLFVVQAGHGRAELAEAAAKQARELAFFPVWGCAHPKGGDPVIQLAPPLVADQSTFDEIEQFLRFVLTEAWTRL